MSFHPERLHVKIPPGVDTGSKVRLAGKGHAGRDGAPPGDLYILTKVKPHAYFERKGDNIYTEVPVTFSEAALGAKIEVQTVDGPASMTIPEGTQSGQKFRLQGRGVQRLKGGGRGDHFVTVKVVVPKGLDHRSRELIRELERAHPENPRAKSKV
jgi:DnaJ-class molecular chaperone